MTEPRGGRPRASSRSVLAEAACELFLEQGFPQTSIADIANRAGVSRSSFFNYFSSKSDVLWAEFDDRVEEALRDLAEPNASIAGALRRIGVDFAPDALALAIAQGEAMGIVEELAEEGALRQWLLGRTVARRLREEGIAPVAADILGQTYGAAVLAAVWEWASKDPGRTTLGAAIEVALQVAEAARAGIAPGLA